MCYLTEAACLVFTPCLMTCVVQTAAHSFYSHIEG